MVSKVYVRCSRVSDCSHTDCYHYDVHKPIYVCDGIRCDKEVVNCSMLDSEVVCKIVCDRCHYSSSDTLREGICADCAEWEAMLSSTFNSEVRVVWLPFFLGAPKCSRTAL